jgi:hypothetical protein
MNEIGIEENESVEKTSNVTIREEVCLSCKGKGTSLGIRLVARLKGLGLGLSGILLTTFSSNEFWGFIGIIIALAGAVSMYMSRVAKCKVCNGTGKIKLETNNIQ